MNIVWSVCLLYGMLFLSQTASAWNILVLMHLSLFFSVLQQEFTNVSGLPPSISRCMGQYFIQLVFSL